MPGEGDLVAPIVPRPTDSDVEAERYYCGDIPFLSDRALLVEECRLVVQLSRFDPNGPSDDDAFEWLSRRYTLVRAERRRRAGQEMPRGHI